jgi:hypothetical protein
MRILFIISSLLLCLGTDAARASTVIDFEGLDDGTLLSTQYAGLTFSNAQILTAGISLNEFEFPPHSGVNVATDSSGPISIVFSSPVQSVGGFFTYADPITLKAFNASSDLIGSASSVFSNNEAISGDAGSHPNELLDIRWSGGISRLTITGAPDGGSVVLDDFSYGAMVIPVPEPETFGLPAIAVLIALVFQFARRRNIHSIL